MKNALQKIASFCCIITLFWSCSNDGFNNNNPYLPNYNFSADINLNLPTFSGLKYPSNAIYYPNVGVRGLILFNTGSNILAFDAACPNQQLSSCSTMQIKGIDAICPCDNQSYSLFSGLGNQKYPMKQYRTEQNGNNVRVYN